MATVVRVRAVGAKLMTDVHVPLCIMTVATDVRGSENRAYAESRIHTWVHALVRQFHCGALPREWPCCSHLDHGEVLWPTRDARSEE